MALAERSFEVPGICYQLLVTDLARRIRGGPGRDPSAEALVRRPFALILITVILSLLTPAVGSFLRFACRPERCSRRSNYGRLPEASPAAGMA
jgi:hypothetical protein